MARGIVSPGTLLALALAVAGAPRAAPASGAVLVLENARRGTRLEVPLAPGEAFSVVSRHSMYDAPVVETFTVRPDGRIALRAVASPSAAAREYLGITGAGERHAVARVLPEIVFRIAMGEPQRLRAGGTERSFLELGDHGDRLVLRAVAAAPRPAAGARAARTGP